MTLNKQTGNMYSWITHTWNPIRGKCPHDCSYCYMKRFKVGELRLDMKALEDDLGEGNTIFVGSSTDMFAEAIPVAWINYVLMRCKAFDNIYLFQSKNPASFWTWRYQFPDNTILGTTIETNLNTGGKAPSTKQRFEAMKMLANSVPKFPLMVSIEPILDFDLKVLVSWMRQLAPDFVSIGADSKGNNLDEPSPEKANKLIEALSEFTKVIKKKNLNRLEGKK